jgi:hypothetical protein
MKPKLPGSTMAEKLQFARNLYREQQARRSKVRWTRRTRHVMVVALVVVVASTIGILLPLTANVIAGGKVVAVVYFLLTVQAALFVALTYSVGGLNVASQYLDERERAVRDHAWALAYRILSVVVVFPSFAVLLAMDLFHWTPAPNSSLHLTEYLLPFLWFVGTLPMAVMAWTLPDPEPEPEI